MAVVDGQPWLQTIEDLEEKLKEANALLAAARDGIVLRNPDITVDCIVAATERMNADDELHDIFNWAIAVARSGAESPGAQVEKWKRLATEAAVPLEALRMVEERIRNNPIGKPMLSYETYTAIKNATNAIRDELKKS